MEDGPQFQYTVENVNRYIQAIQKLLSSTSKEINKLKKLLNTVKDKKALDDIQTELYRFDILRQEYSKALSNWHRITASGHITHHNLQIIATIFEYLFTESKYNNNKIKSYESSLRISKHFKSETKRPPMEYYDDLLKILYNEIKQKIEGIMNVLTANLSDARKIGDKSLIGKIENILKEIKKHDIFLKTIKNLLYGRSAHTATTEIEKESAIEELRSILLEIEHIEKTTEEVTMEFYNHDIEQIHDDVVEMSNLHERMDNMHLQDQDIELQHQQLLQQHPELADELNQIYNSMSSEGKSNEERINDLLRKHGKGRNKPNPYDILHKKGHEGKFTSQFKARRPQHRHIQTIHDFAHYILQNPSEFNKISHQRANYYVNLIQHKPKGEIIKRLHKCHKLCGGKLSAKEFELMLKESYKKPEQRDKKIGDYYIDESLSTPENVVYHNQHTGETKVAYRGTEGTLKDWSNNLKFAVGGMPLYKKTGRYKRAEDIQKQVENKYGTSNLDVLGHSQAGLLAKELGQNASNIVTLNTASSPFYKNEKGNQTNIRSTSDLVSAVNKLNPFNWGKKSNIEIKSNTYNPVAEHMPDVLQNLPENTILGKGRGKDMLDTIMNYISHRNRVSKHYERNNPFKIASQESLKKSEQDLKNYKKQFGGKKPHKKLRLLF